MVVVPRSAVFLNPQRGRFPARNEVVTLFANIKKSYACRLESSTSSARHPRKYCVLRCSTLSIVVVVAQAATASPNNCCSLLVIVGDGKVEAIKPSNVYNIFLDS